MSLFRIFVCLLFATFSVQFSAAAFASAADISGHYAIEYPSETQVRVDIDKISNNTTNRTTGTLYVTLRYTKSSTPFSSGYDVSQFSLSFIGSTNGQLQPGHSFTDISVTRPANLPPAGTYYVHLLTSEYPNLNTVLDYVTFPRTSTVGGGGGGGGTSGANITINGSVSYQVQGENVEIRIDRLENNPSNTTTGTLYATLFFSESSNVISTGYIGARERLNISNNGRMGPNTYVTGLVFSTPYTEPPPGRYYAHLYISQYPELDAVLDSVTFDSQLVVSDGIEIPSIPILNRATDGEFFDRVELGWSSVNDATSYKVYRSSASGSSGTLIKTTSGTSYNDYAGNAGIRYYYSVRACNSAGCSSFSSQNQGWRKAQTTKPPEEYRTAGRDDVMRLARLYAAAFDRTPDRNGLNFWVETWQKGKQIVEIAAKFVESREFRSRYGNLTDTGFVRALFRNVLGREPAQSGLDFWVEKLNTGSSRARVLEQISASPENVRRTENWTLSGSSNNWSITVPPPGPTSVPNSPNFLSASSDNSSWVDINWVGSAGAERYEVCRKEFHVNGEYRCFAQTNAVSWQDSQVIRGVEHEYVVRACNSLGCSSFSNMGVGSRLPYYTRQPAIEDLTSSSAGIVIQFEQFSTADYYEIIVRPKNSKYEISADPSVSSRRIRFGDAILPRGNRYCFHVRACAEGDDKGCSSAAREGDCIDHF